MGKLLWIDNRLDNVQNEIREIKMTMARLSVSTGCNRIQTRRILYLARGKGGAECSKAAS